MNLGQEYTNYIVEAQDNAVVVIKFSKPHCQIEREWLKRAEHLKPIRINKTVVRECLSSWCSGQKHFS